jgi:thioesterase domain-containing protein
MGLNRFAGHAQTRSLLLRLDPHMPANSSEANDAQARRDRLRQAAQERLLEDIPLARFIQLQIGAWDGATLDMRAPLAPNINDKGCAFGGSLASVMTLACWALIKLAADERGVSCDIYVQDSSLRYLAPVGQDFAARARLADDQPADTFFETLAARGKARMSVHCEVRAGDGTIACSLAARFVAVAPAAAVSAGDAAQCTPDRSTRAAARETSS